MKLSYRKKGRTVEQRFYDFALPEPNTGCWLWTGYLSGSGYARFNVGNAKHIQASRYSWELHKGPIPDGLQACHICDVRCCVNPDHLFLGTQSDNLNDMEQKGRGVHLRGESHPKARLTEDDVRNIRTDQRQLKIIGADYGVDKQYIWKIKRGVHWGHVK